MIYSNLVIFLFVFLLYNSVLALDQENIVGGFIDKNHIFRYTVSVQVKNNHSSPFTHICGAGVLSVWLSISAAHCFINKKGQINSRPYSIVAGTNNLDSDLGFRVYISEFFIPGFEPTFTYFNIALTKSQTPLQIIQNGAISSLQIPPPTAQYGDGSCILCGFGYEQAHVRTDSRTGQEVRDVGNISPFLKFLGVKVLTDKDCLRYYPIAPVDRLVCGLADVQVKGQKWGFCSGDGGGPLFAGNVVVGIASKNSLNCNDAVAPGIYTKITPFFQFVTDIMQNITTGYMSYFLPIY